MIVVMMRMIMIIRPVPSSSIVVISYQAALVMQRMLRCSLSSQPLVMLRMLR